MAKPFHKVERDRGIAKKTSSLQDLNIPRSLNAIIDYLGRTA